MSVATQEHINSLKFIETAERNKFYYGMYLSVAQRNAYLSLKSIYEKLEIKEEKRQISEDNPHKADIFCELIPPDENTSNCDAHPYVQLRPSEIESRKRLLAKHFPAFRKLSETINEKGKVTGFDVVRLAKLLKCSLEYLNKLRNYFSHYYHKPISGDTIPDIYLPELLEAAVEKVQKRFPDINTEHGEYLKTLPLTVDNQYNYNGGILFMCMFLDRRNAFAFLKTTYMRGFKDSRTPDMRVKPEAFIYFCARPPQPKLGSSDLPLDMLTEISRCPNEIFQLLSTNDKKKFEADIDDDAKPTELDEFLKDELPPRTANMKRKAENSHFPRYAMRYFDEQKKFGRLRFQLLCAKFNCADYKSTILEQERNRKIEDTLTVFTRLNEITEDEIESSWKTEDTDNEHIGIKQYSPKYNIVGNRIAIKILPEEITNDIETTSIVHPKSTHTDKPRHKVNHPLPTAILSVHELQNLFLFRHLHNEENATENFIETYIKRFRDFCQEVNEGDFLPVSNFLDCLVSKKSKDQDKAARKTALQAKLKAKKLHINDLPDQMRDYLMGYTQDNHSNQLKAKLKAKIIETEALLSNAKRGKDAQGRDLKDGRMATYIARDLIFFKKKNNSGGKANNEQYNELQKAIALFPSHKGKLGQYFKDLNLLDSSTGHQFLHEIPWSYCVDTADFYTDYLEGKKTWLESCRRKLSSKQADIQQFFKLKKTDSKNLNYRFTVNQNSMTEEPAPIYLPRGLFNGAIRKAMKNQGFDVNKETSITKCFELISKQDTQTFYTHPRTYYDGIVITGKDDMKAVKADIQQKTEQTKTKLKRIKNKKSEDAKKLQYKINDLNKLPKEIYRNELKIRFIQANDRAAFMMIQEMLEAKIKADQVQLRAPDSDTSKWQLRKVGFDVKDNILDQKHLMQHTYKLEYKDKNNSNNDEYFGSRTIQALLPFKQYGKFRRFLKDKRLWSTRTKDGLRLPQGLLSYYSEGDVIELETIRREFVNFDTKCYEETLLHIYDFESILHQEFQTEFNEKIRNKKSLRHGDQLALVQTKILNNTSVLTNPDKDDTAIMRNKIFHHQIPNNDWLTQKVIVYKGLEANRKKQDEDNPFITQQIFVGIQTVYKDLTQRMKIRMNQP